MKRNILSLIALFLVLSILTLTVVGCGGRKDDTPTPDPDPTPTPDPDPNPNPDPDPDPDPNPEDKIINFAEEGVLIYGEDGLSLYAESLASRMSVYTGVTILTTPYKAEAKIVFEKMDTGKDFEDVGLVGKFSVKVVDGVLHILASDTKAMQHALNRVYKMVKPGSMKVSEIFSEDKTFDNFKSTSSFLIELGEEKVAAMALVDRITVNGKTVGGFSPYTNDYVIAFPSLSGYPDISARAVSDSATVSVIQPADNGGTGIISVTNGAETKVYTVKVSLESVYMNASVINKNNTLGTVTFVIDDGDKDSASFVVNQLLPKYENVSVTFAIYTNQFATLTKNAAGTEYVMDENGKYVYTVNQANRDFWVDLHSRGRVSITSHSHTHQYWGENDDGGSFNYVNNSGTALVSPSFPKGNVTAELLASQQIVRDLFGDGSNVFVMPGVGAPLSQYYYDLLRNAGFYIGARNTAASVNNLASMVGMPEHFADKANRFNIKGYMIQHYNTSPTVTTDKNSSASTCLSAGIPYWTDFIDTAIDMGGWACFCIHNIRPDDYTNTSGEHFIYQSQADALFAHANEYGDSVWITTLEDATKYYNLRAATTVTAELVDNMKMTVALSDSEKSAVYSDVVLTVRVDVPTYWKRATVGDTEYEVLEDENGKYIIMNLARGAYVTVDGEGDLGGDDADFEFMPVVGGQDVSLALPGGITLGENTPLYYNYDDPTSAALAHALAEELSKVSGKNIIPTPDRKLDTTAPHIRIVTPGALDGIGIALNIKSGSLGAYRIYMNGEGLYISSTDATALAVAMDCLVGGYSDGRLVADAKEHYVDADGAEVSQDVLADSTELSEIVIGGVRFDGFDPSVRTYEVGADILSGYPIVEYKTYYGGSSVSITLPSVENGGVCRIAVCSESGKVGVYTLGLKSSAVSTEAEVVNKGGADGAVTFVFDDGHHSTALYLADVLLPKYNRVKVTLGLVMNQVCSLVYDEVGDCWMKDVHGNYIYVAKQSEVDFWREIIRCGQVELVSHSYSHAYWGEDDGGGVFVYIDNTGASVTSQDFPKGNVTAELAASKQMIKELFGMESYSYILPGLRVKKLSDYYYNLIPQHYIGARSGFSVQNGLQAPTLPSEMANPAYRYKVRALTTQYFATVAGNNLAKGQDSSVYLAAGIPAWEDYIDSAINQNGWSVFLLHTVIDDGATPNDYSIFRSQAEALFAYADAYGDRIWFPTYDEGTIYYTQWSTATVNAVASDSRIRVDLSHAEKGEMYNMAMTVRVELPDGFDGAYVGGEALEIHEDDGVRYVFVDVTPDVPLFINGSVPRESGDADFEYVPVV